jgi:SAM-dependent methyltransferase
MSRLQSALIGQGFLDRRSERSAWIAVAREAEMDVMAGRTDVQVQDRSVAVCCQVCSHTGGRTHIVFEMMFGTREAFDYWECGFCGGISLVTPPKNLGSYYPGKYYDRTSRLNHRLRALRDRIYLSPLSGLVNWRVSPVMDALRRAGLTPRTRLLDVGCGVGHLISDLRRIGYQAEGIDPFAGQDTRDGFGIRVRRSRLDEIEETYDVLLFCHSLEHAPDQVETLRLARSRLNPGGVCVVMIPLVGWAWTHYGVHWAQLDAPRHWFLHTEKSLGIAAAAAGFEISETIFDSNEFQFFASELYRSGRPLRGSPCPGLLTRARLRHRARQLNRARQGDSAQFFLRPR